MKIIINALSARLGGGQTYLRNLLSHLPKQANLAIYIFAPASLKLPDDPRIKRCFTRWPTENPILRTLWEKLVLPRILAKEKAHVYFCPGGVISSAAPKGCKTVTMFRNMIPFDRNVLARIPWGLQKIRNYILRHIMLRSMAGADLTIFISDFAKFTIEKLISLRKSVIIPHGINSAFRTFDTTLHRPAWLPAEEYLLYVSRFDVYKHQLEVVTAFLSLPPDLINQYVLLLVGETDQLLTRQVSDLVASKGFSDRVQIVGPVVYEELPALYHHATINLFASSCENCPNIMLEALGAGKAVVSSNIMPMPEFGMDSVDYFVPTDSQSIHDALIRVLRNERYKSHLAIAAAKRSMDFDWDRAAQKTWEQIIEIGKV